MDGVAVVADMTSLTEGQVRAAVAYHADHRAEIDERIAANEEVAQELEAARHRSR